MLFRSIDRRVRLNDAVDWAPGVTALNLSSEAADDAGCERVIEPKRVPDREDTLAHHGVSARSDDERFHLPQRLWVVHLQHGDVLIVVVHSSYFSRFREDRQHTAVLSLPSLSIPVGKVISLHKFDVLTVSPANL